MTRKRPSQRERAYRMTITCAHVKVREILEWIDEATYPPALRDYVLFQLRPRLSNLDLTLRDPEGRSTAGALLKRYKAAPPCVVRALRRALEGRP